jgi:hypothetical protein
VVSSESRSVAVSSSGLRVMLYALGLREPRTTVIGLGMLPERCLGGGRRADVVEASLKEVEEEEMEPGVKEGEAEEELEEETV